jgi:hypothetical protein
VPPHPVVQQLLNNDEHDIALRPHRRRVLARLVDTLEPHPDQCRSQPIAADDAHKFARGQFVAHDKHVLALLDLARRFRIDR